MRKIASAFIVTGLASITGCGCLESMTIGPEYRLGGSHPDPSQPRWQQCLFGTRYVRNLSPHDLRIMEEGNRGEQLEQGLKRYREHPELIPPRSDDTSK